MRVVVLAVLCALALTVSAQQGTISTQEGHPSITTSTCTSSGCTTQNSKVVLDANWRWLHTSSGNCYDGNSWNSQYTTNAGPAQQCHLEGISTSDYQATYGVSTNGNALKLVYVTVGTYGTNYGSRTYLMSDDQTYQMFHLKNQEFSFDVDVSQLVCGLNGALYFVDMDSKGNMGVGNNQAGAQYGTGYCDAQCPQDIKFMNGQANVQGWGTPSAMGACCTEMDIWEANKMATAYTPHTCNSTGIKVCTDSTSCGLGSQRNNGVCDKDGCDFNSFRMGNQNFFGPGMTVDTTQKITVVTQFKTTDGTANGDLNEITRFYVQNGKVIPNSQSTVAGVSGNSITNAYCAAEKTAFGDSNTFAARGGLKAMGDAFTRGMALVMSVWDDGATNMNWLDSTPQGASGAGSQRGTCDPNAGNPSTLRANYPNAYVQFSNIKWGTIGSTNPGANTPAPTTQSPSGTTTQSPSGTTTQSPSGTTTQSPSGVTTTKSPSGSTTTTVSGGTCPVCPTTCPVCPTSAPGNLVGAAGHVVVSLFTVAVAAMALIF